MQENAEKQTQSGGSSIRRSAPRKKKKNQVPFGFLGLLLIAVIAIVLGQKNGTLALFWVFGCCFGFILQKARFCFTASMRDPCITGSKIGRASCRERV